MNIENVWNQSDGANDELKNILHNINLHKMHSKLPLVKLKKTMSMGLGWAIVITAFYVTLFFFVNIWQVYIALSVLVLFNIRISVDGWRLYKNLDVDISSTNSLKEELQKNYAGFQKWWSIQQKLGLFVYPIAAAGGFILGGVWGSGKPADVFLHNPKTLLIFVISIAVFVPLGFYLAKRMFDYAYGDHLKKIKTFIDELSV